MMNDELYHHGVSGMKWGKRNGPPYPLNAEGKADLKKQKKQAAKLEEKAREDYAQHKTYNKIRAKEAVKRDVAIAMVGGGAVGTVAGGPLGGVAAMLGAGLATTAVSSVVNAGRNAVSNSKYKKMLLSDAEFAKNKEAGEKILEQRNTIAKEQERTNIKSMQDSGYKLDPDYGGDFLIKKKNNVVIQASISAGQMADSNHVKTIKEIEKAIPEMKKQLDSEVAKHLKEMKDKYGYEQKVIPNSHYLYIGDYDYAMMGVDTTDGHALDLYVDLKNKKLDTTGGLMMNG